MNENILKGVTARSIEGHDCDLVEYSGKLVLVVNTACDCGMAIQLSGLEKIWRRYRDKGLAILAFPSAQFSANGPTLDEEVGACHRGRFGCSFPLFAPVHVTGPAAFVLFQRLAARAPGLMPDSINWNFTKFLISRDGSTVQRFAPGTAPEMLIGAIEAGLS